MFRRLFISIVIVCIATIVLGVESEDYPPNTSDILDDFQSDKLSSEHNQILEINGQYNNVEDDENIEKRAPMDRSSMIKFGKRAQLDRAMVRFGRAPLDRSSMVRFGRAPLTRTSMIRFGKRAPLDRAMVRFGKRAPLDRAMVRFGKRAPLDRAMVRFGKRAPLDRAMVRFGKRSE
ncbi:Hypothetical protein SRAE_X000053000 [Strongyloides ratti]|uniref:Uncharacterized protein n=1 Tax=Strongyloides ratti TaxID=34506 RepID=A0A090N0S6_STRRB|nr:Hypothetical protein SRAE_X000053000 [Strongyloides ratti]CEF71203.1 Hypothetical protein SRAE_X000053000 [Strongyloides ratti]